MGKVTGHKQKRSVEGWNGNGNERKVMKEMGRE